MKKKVLMVTNTASMIELFNIHNLRILDELGAELYVATNFNNPGTISQSVSDRLKNKLKAMNIKYFNVDFPRGIGNPYKNWRAYHQLLDIVEQNKIDVIHTHAPLSSILSRQVAHKKGITCIYTSHGFQFFPGGPLRYWLFFYGIEWYYSRYTDALITINKDDYQVAQKFLAKKVYYIPGVGTSVKELISMSQTRKDDIRRETRKLLNIKNTDYMILSVGELSKRKNHITVLKAIAKLHNPNIKYVIAGIGPEKENLLATAKKFGIENQLKLIGFQNNVQKLYLAADLNAFLSTREGLGMGGLEGCVLGLYILSSRKTGVKDYVTSKKMGLLVEDPLNVSEVTKAIKTIIENKYVGKPDYQELLKFDQTNIDRKMKKIYRKVLNNN